MGEEKHSFLTIRWILSYPINRRDIQSRGEMSYHFVDSYQNSGTNSSYFSVISEYNHYYTRIAYQKHRFYIQRITRRISWLVSVNQSFLQERHIPTL